MNKKNFVLGIILFGILLINFTLVSAQVSYCCEKIKDGGPWCMNAPENECDDSYRSVPTSCEATSYCRLGTCIDTQEGTCMENTPQVTCNVEDGGFWEEGNADELPQCQLGCCLIGDQAAFVTQTRCKTLSSLYGLETNYRTDIQSEMQCIASASPGVKGACVFEREYQKTCKLLTKQECQEMEISSGYSNVKFHEGYLCSAVELATNCGPRGGTTCVEGKDEVYFLDTCGNLANVYDSNKINDATYWTYIAGVGGVTICNPASTTCGNCDYFSGTTCKEVLGKHVCEDLSCEYEGKDYQHGETWCAKAKGIKDNLPGSRYFRMVCYNGEVSVEPCADYRQEVCIQSEVNTFRTAACRVNMWQDCYAQDNAKDCTNEDKRDCKVIEGFSILTDENGVSLFLDEDGETADNSCVPLHNPGFDFWEEGGDAESLCSLGTTMCIIDYEAGIFKTLGGKRGKIVPNEECVDACKDRGGEKDDCEDECTAKCVDEDGNLLDSWEEEMNEMCVSLGDCGSSLNYIGKEGYYDTNDFIVMSSEEEDEEN